MGQPGACGSDAACPQYLSRGLQRGPDHLIHVVVAVLGEATHEGYALLSRGEGSGSKDRRHFAGSAHDRRTGMVLACKVLELGDAYVIMLVWIVDGRHPLVRVKTPSWGFCTVGILIEPIIATRVVDHMFSVGAVCKGTPPSGRATPLRQALLDGQHDSFR